MNKTKPGAKVLAILAVSVVLAVAFWYTGMSQDNSTRSFLTEPAYGLLPGLDSETIPDIVEQASPAVVRIDTTQQSNSSEYYLDPFFRQFFGTDILPSQPRIHHGMGSGFIVSEDGYILTNEHVVTGADSIEVTLSGHESAFPAVIIGSDKELDLAVLKIESAEALPALKLGDFSKVRVGEWVIAIGNPYGLDHTVTVGVISATGRPIAVQDRQYKNLLQTDASINPGNSGGPLLNLNGEVVGINTAVNYEAQGIGFAIPSSTVSEAFSELVEKGGIDRPWLGVGLQPVTRQIARYLGLRDTSGALVNQVVADSPAGKGGLEIGDVIISFNDVEVNTPDELTAAVRETEIGTDVVIEFIRDGEIITITVTIESKQSN